MLGERLSMLRKERNLTMKEIGSIIGVTDGAWNKYEKNRAEPSIENIIKIANYFDVSLDFLLGKTNLRDTSIIEKANIQNELLKKFEELNVGDPSSMNNIIDNLLLALDKYSDETISENELQLLLKSVNDLILHFNAMTDLRDEYKRVNSEVMNEHVNTAAELFRNLNDMLSTMFADYLK